MADTGNYQRASRLTPHCCEQEAFIVSLGLPTVPVKDFANFFKEALPLGFSERLHVTERQEQVQGSR